MDDLEFAQRCAKANRQSWEEFLKRYSRLIYNYIYHVLGAKGYAFAQDNIHDIFQEILCSLIKDNFKKLKSFKAKNGCTLASWLRLVTINHTIDRLRRISAFGGKPEVSMDEESGEEYSLKERLSDGSVPAPDALNQEERISSLKECIKNLENDDKLFLELNINQGLSLESLRGIFKVSRGAIDMQRRRIIERLRECFKAKGFAFP